MKIRVKGLTAEVEVELPGEDKMITYQTANIKAIMNAAKDQVIEIETLLLNSQKKASD